MQKHLTKEENCEKNIFLSVVFLKSVALVIYNSCDQGKEGEHSWKYGAKTLFLYAKGGSRILAPASVN